MQQIKNSLKILRVTVLALVLVLQFSPAMILAQTKVTNTTTQQRCDAFKNQFSLTNGVNLVTNYKVFCSATDFMLALIKFIQVIAGIVTVLFLMIGGFMYITSAGNDEQSEKAKKILTNSVIGLAVILLSYAIVRVVTSLISLGT